ncbi:hypothetical protein ALI22I_01585 [Saccharothrix sp. ALI-22-I]|nr:hypothetical protein ALI22I_01585 [Saccharothrix sp. ALI-22-I]
MTDAFSAVRSSPAWFSSSPGVVRTAAGLFELVAGEHGAVGELLRLSRVRSLSGGSIQVSMGGVLMSSSRCSTSGA